MMEEFKVFDEMQKIIFIVLAVFAIGYGYFWYRLQKIKHQKQKIDEKKIEDGKAFEKYVGEIYQKRGYEVDFRGLELGVKDGGIDLIAKRNGQIILIQCKNWKVKNSIEHNHIKEFYGNCNFYIDKFLQDVSRENIKSIMALSNFHCISFSAKIICKENAKNCNFEVHKMDQINTCIGY